MMARHLHEAMTLLEPEHQYALQLLMAREAGYESTLQGIAANGTKCPTCEMLRDIAVARLEAAGVPWGFGRIADAVNTEGAT
jgi:hypothetical protein